MSSIKNSDEKLDMNLAFISQWVNYSNEEIILIIPKSKEACDTIIAAFLTHGTSYVIFNDAIVIDYESYIDLFNVVISQENDENDLDLPF